MNNQEQFILSTISYYQKNNRTLSLSRLTLLLFLSDWIYTLKYNDRLLNFKWKYRNNLESDEVLSYLNKHKNIQIQSTNFVLPKLILNTSLVFSTTTDEKLNYIFQTIIEKTFNTFFSELSSIFINSYPIKKCPRYYEIDLISDANNYIESLDKKQNK